MARLAKRSDICVLRARVYWDTESNGVWLRRNSVPVKVLEVYSVGEDFDASSRLAKMFCVPGWLEKMYGEHPPRFPGKAAAGKARPKPRSREDIGLHNYRSGFLFKRRWGVAGVPLGSLESDREYWLAIDWPPQIGHSIIHAEPVK